jgi:hypothetical protein
MRNKVTDHGPTSFGIDDPSNDEYLLLRRLQTAKALPCMSRP